MSKVADLLRTGTSGALLIDGWRWWLDELRGMVPPGLSRVLATQSNWLVLDLSENSLIVGQLLGGNYQRVDSIDLLEAELPAKPAVIAACLQKSGMSIDRIAVALSPKQVLLRQLDLPLTAPRHLRALVRHELDRCQPLPTDQIYFDCRILSRDPSLHRMRVELAIVKRALVDRMTTILAGWGLAPQIVGLRDSSAWPFNFLRDQRKSRRLRLSLTGCLLILSLGLSLGALKTVFDRHDARAEALRVAVAAAKAAAGEVEAKRHQADGIADRLRFMAERYDNGPAGPWVEALTRALPDGTWVVDVERHGQSLRLRGYSKEASALIGQLDASPWFGNAHFTAPLTPGGLPGAERFDLTLDLRGGARHD